MLQPNRHQVIAPPVPRLSPVPFIRFLDPDGRPVAALPPAVRDPARLVEIYRAMTLTRTFDQKAMALQRSGRLGTYASSLGEEAVGVGVGAAMAAEDVLVPSFRSHGAQLWRGVTLTELLLLWGGDERGSDFAGPREDFPIAIPVGSHAPHAAGVALALKLRGGGRATVCLLGDGATSKGDFYEALNIAGVWRLPVVFVVANNQWAISLPRARQTAAETIAQKAWAAGFDGVQVDGNDVTAVVHATGTALQKARAGDGPTLIEALTYRLSDHTTADDATRYRPVAEVEARWAEDPILRLRRYLSRAGVWTREDEKTLHARCIVQVDAAEKDYLATPPQPASAMFDYLYAALPDALAAQRAEAVAQEADRDG